MNERIIKDAPLHVQKITGPFIENKPKKVFFRGTTSGAFSNLVVIRAMMESRREGSITYGGMFGHIFNILTAAANNDDNFVLVLRSLVLHLEIAALVREKYRLADNRKELEVSNITNANITALLSQTQVRQLNGLPILAGATASLNDDLIRMLVTGTVGGKETISYSAIRPIPLAVGVNANLESRVMALRQAAIVALDASANNIGTAGMETVADLNANIANISLVRRYDLFLQMYNNPAWLFKIFNDDNSQLQGSAGHDLRRDQLMRLASVFKAITTYGNMLSHYFNKYAYEQSFKLFNVMNDAGVDDIPRLTAEVESFDYLNCKKDFDDIMGYIKDTDSGSNVYDLEVSVIFAVLNSLMPVLPQLPVPPTPPLPLALFTGAINDNVLFGNAIAGLTSGLALGPYDMYQNPNLIFGVDTAWAAILRTVITTLHNQSYNAEQKNFLMQVASKMDAHKLPLVIPKFLLHDYTSYTAHRIVNNEFIFNNIDGASDTDTIANLTGTIPNPTVVGDTLSDPFVPIGIFDPDQIPRYKAVLGLGDTLTYAIPAQLLEEREVIPIQEMTVPVNPWASKMMNSLSSDTIHFAAKLLGLQYEVARQGLVSQAIRAKLATCVSGVGMVFHIPLFAIGGVGAINWNDIVPNSRGFLNQIAVMIRGGAINPVAYDGLAYGNTVAENLPYLTRMMPATLAEAANSNLNFSVARLADNSVLVIAFYAFIPPFGAGIAKVPVQMGNDTVFVPQGRSGLTVGNNVLTAGALQFICTHKDPITAFMSDTIAQDDKNAAVYFHTDHAVYSFRDIVATARLPYLAKNNDKRVLKIQFPIEEVEYPNILPPGARFKSYALPANEFVPGITNDVTASEIQDRLEKISKYERENTMLEKKETEKVKESNIANTISTDANSIKDVQATQNEAGVVTTSERDVDALVARNSEEKKDGPKAKTLTKKK